MTADPNDSLVREAIRLRESPSDTDAPAGLGTVRFIVCCPDDPSAVIERAKAVLRIVNDNCVPRFPDDATWVSLLPTWFLEQCAPERTRQDAERQAMWENSLSDEERARVVATKAWSAADWLYWLRPENRFWYWWDAVAINETIAAVAVEVHEWPLPTGALSWLLRASGAERVDAEDD